MKHLSYACSLFVVLSLTACAAPRQQGQTVELPQRPTLSRYELPHNLAGKQAVETAHMFSNQNVIVYPLDGSIAEQRQQFPQYRGVMENTTASGYTVFDESVTVYAVEENGNQPPSYLPEYSVPRYVNEGQMNSQITARGPLPLPLRNEVVSEPLSDMNTSNTMASRRGPRLTGYSGVSRPMTDNNAQVPRLPAMKAEESRSRRLTGY